MTTLSDKMEHNRTQKIRAKEDNNYAVLLGLFVIGWGLMARYAVSSAHHSVRDFLARLKNNVGSEEVRELGPHVLKDDDNER